MTRDYKSARGHSGGLSGAAGFLLGLAIGLGVALGVFIYDRRPAPPEKPSPEKPSAPASDVAAEDPGQQYEFYELLRKFEVMPEPEKSAPKGTPPKPVDKPGTYVLQVGSYRKFADADKVRAQLALEGIEARIQEVSLNDEIRHRVWVGPTTDLAFLNRTRDRLRASGRDVILLTMRE